MVEWPRPSLPYPYSPKCVEWGFCELRLYGVLRNSHSLGPASMSVPGSDLLPAGIITTPYDSLIILIGRALRHGCSWESREYLTLDRWASRAAYEAFRARRSGEYRRLDARSEGLTEEETFLGAFEVLP